MRTTDIIRAVLDILDDVDNSFGKAAINYPENEPGEQTSRFKQILAMLQNPSQGEYSNTPNEIVTSVDSVTVDAGGGVNGPKHPADLRVKDPQGFDHNEGY